MTFPFIAFRRFFHLISRHLFVSSLLLSFLFHALACLSIIVLVYPQPISIKPNFVFLGSVLQKSELSMSPGYLTQFQKASTSPSAQILLHDTPTKNHVNIPKKPFYSRNINARAKKTGKITAFGFYSPPSSNDSTFRFNGRILFAALQTFKMACI